MTMRFRWKRCRTPVYVGNQMPVQGLGVGGQIHSLPKWVIEQDITRRTWFDIRVIAIKASAQNFKLQQ